MSDEHTPPSATPAPLGDSPAPPVVRQTAADWRPHPKCTSCGYELVGLRVEDLCPECGAPVWGSSKVPPTSGLAIASLVLGILSIVSCLGVGPLALIPGVLAIVFGEFAARQYRNGLRAGGTYGMALAGRICGWIGVVISGGFILMIVGSMLHWW